MNRQLWKIFHLDVVTVQSLELELEAYHVQSVRVEYSLENVTQQTGPVGIAQIKGFKFRNAWHSFSSASRKHEECIKIWESLDQEIKSKSRDADMNQKSVEDFERVSIIALKLQNAYAYIF